MPDAPLKAIQTRYAGCHFRSRLEARWAVFFDQLGIRWEYEPEGFETSAGRYLPDFRIQIPQVKAYGDHQWFEVKPDGFDDDPRHAALARESGEPVIVAAGMARDYITQMRGFHSPLMIHGIADRPWPVAFCDSTDLTYTQNYCALGDNRHWCQEAMNHTLSGERCHLALYGWHEWDGKHQYTTFPPFISKNVDAAYTAARSARFEHGAEGAPQQATKTRWRRVVRPSSICTCGAGEVAGRRKGHLCFCGGAR